MRIAFDGKPKKKWGGGSHFATALSQSLEAEGHKVCYDLKYPVDAIVVIFRKGRISIDFRKIKAYIQKHPKTVVIQRINNLDTHSNKGSIKLYIKYNNIATATVYVSHWAQRNLHKKGVHLKNEHVIVNDVSRSFMKIRDRWDKSGPVKIVTHHWSTNLAKGFDFYRQMSREWKNSSYMKNNTNLMYIGRLPRGLVLKNFKHKILFGDKLSDKLRARDVYITASKKECGPYHVMEALRCGLPVLYGPNGGAVEEYVGDCGLMFDPKKPIKKYIKMIVNDYDKYYDRIVDRFGKNIPSLSERYIRVVNECR